MPNRSVYRQQDGTWVNKRDDSDRASSLHTTQKDAEQAAKEMLHNQGGGEVSTHGLNGQIRIEDTIARQKTKSISVSRLILVDL